LSGILHFCFCFLYTTFLNWIWGHDIMHVAIVDDQPNYTFTMQIKSEVIFSIYRMIKLYLDPISMNFFNIIGVVFGLPKLNNYYWNITKFERIETIFFLKHLKYFYNYVKLFTYIYIVLLIYIYIYIYIYCFRCKVKSLLKQFHNVHFDVVFSLFG